MKKLKWTPLGGWENKDLDEAMPIVFDIINMEIEQKGKVSKETWEVIYPAFEVLEARTLMFEINMRIYELMKATH